jgi:hypothetical protein
MKKIRNIDKAKLAKYILVASTLSFISESALAAFDLDAFGKAFVDPTKKFVTDYYPWGIFATGLGGAFMARDGDLRERFLGFGKGSVIAGLVVGAAKLGLGV